MANFILPVFGEGDHASSGVVEGQHGVLTGTIPARDLARKLRRLHLVAVAMLSVAGAASAETTVGQSPCNYSAEDARRIDFLAAYRKAHAARLAATCFNDDPVIARLDKELDATSKAAQRRNPDVDLSTLEATTGLDVCRMSSADVRAGCAANRAEALVDYAETMTQLRKFTTRWR